LPGRITASAFWVFMALLRYLFAKFGLLSRWEKNFQTSPVGSHNRQDKALGTVGGMGHVKTAGHNPMAKPCVQFN